jgi:phage baseplate assembly protein gpV
MSSLTPRMSLKRPDDTDAFLTQEFVDNLNKLDAAPGVHICTSTTRPSWNSSQQGRTIWVTDWKCLQYWDGTAWQFERAATGLYAGGATFNATLSANASATYNLVSFTTPRPASIAIMMNFTIGCDARFTQTIFGRIVYDGGDLLLGDYSDAMRFTGNSSDPSAETQMTLPLLAVVDVAAGSHTIGGKVTVGGYSSSVTLRGMKTISVLGLYSSSQVL